MVNYGTNQSHERLSSTANKSINLMSQNESNFRMSSYQNEKGSLFSQSTQYLNLKKLFLYLEI